MSRWNYSSKTDADGLNKISANFLTKHGYFKKWNSGTITWTRSGTWGESKNSVSIEVPMIEGDEYLRIHYTHTASDTGEKKPYDYKIPITSTPCHYGNKRYWFICPMFRNGKYCGRRVGTLYLGGPLFACRHCYDLTYESRKENRRHTMFGLFNLLTIEDKIEKLEMGMRRRYYAGQPTKKQSRLERLRRRGNMGYLNYERLAKQKLV